MHDYHKAKDMVEFAQAKAVELGKNSVAKVLITVGESSGYSADTIVMYFKELAEGTVCENAEIVVTNVKSMLECPSCGKIFPRKLMEYACPVCGVEGVPSKIGTGVFLEDVVFE